MPIPEEWKPSASRVYDSHKVQLGTYFILIEEETGIRPPYGYISLARGRLLTDLHQTITQLDVVLVWLGVAPCRV